MRNGMVRLWSSGMVVVGAFSVMYSVWDFVGRFVKVAGVWLWFMIRIASRCVAENGIVRNVQVGTHLFNHVLVYYSEVSW